MSLSMHFLWFLMFLTQQVSIVVLPPAPLTISVSQGLGTWSSGGPGDVGFLLDKDGQVTAVVIRGMEVWRSGR